MMYYILFSSLRTALEKWRETWSNQFCNMLICAVSQLLQRADVGYNLPLELWILHQSIGKVHQILLMLAVLKMHVHSVKNERAVWRYQIGLAPGLSPPEEPP